MNNRTSTEIVVHLVLVILVSVRKINISQTKGTWAWSWGLEPRLGSMCELYWFMVSDLCNNGQLWRSGFLQRAQKRRRGGYYQCKLRRLRNLSVNSVCFYLHAIKFNALKFRPYAFFVWTAKSQRRLKRVESILSEGFRHFLFYHAFFVGCNLTRLQEEIWEAHLIFKTDKSLISVLSSSFLTLD